MSLIAELKRRNVFRVGAAYAIVGWLLVEVASVLLPTFDAPDWVMKAFSSLVILGFPLTLVIAWAFELTPEGIKREAEVDRTESVRHSTGRKLDFAIIGLLALAVVYFAVDKFVLEAEPGQTETTAESIAQEKSIAVLPFVNMSADADQEYFSDGITEEILNTLVAIDELQVAGRTSSFTFKDRKDVDLKTIGQRLGVSNLLEGSVRKAGNKVRITAQLITAENGFHLWSETYDRELADIFEIQEEIASAIGEALQVELGLKVAQSLDRRHTDNTEAYQWYLRGVQLSGYDDIKNYKLAAEAYQKAITLDPNYVPPYVGYALAQTDLIYSGDRVPSPNCNRRRNRHSTLSPSWTLNTAGALLPSDLYMKPEMTGSLQNRLTKERSNWAQRISLCSLRGPNILGGRLADPRKRSNCINSISSGSPWICARRVALPLRLRMRGGSPRPKQNGGASSSSTLAIQRPSSSWVTITNTI